MLWTTLQWNWGNTSAIAALCLLPIITFGVANPYVKQSTDIIPFAKLQNGNFELPASLAQSECRTNDDAITGI
jgi:hypothetical protein